jgi:selenocysteine lyase/cysteine desulfurase
VTFSVAGVDSSEVETRLRQLGINVSVTTASSTLIDATRRELPDMVRSSVHYYNLDSELEALVNTVTEIANPVS